MAFGPITALAYQAGGRGRFRREAAIWAMWKWRAGKAAAAAYNLPRAGATWRRRPAALWRAWSAHLWAGAQRPGDGKPLLSLSARDPARERAVPAAWRRCRRTVMASWRRRGRPTAPAAAASVMAPLAPAVAWRRCGGGVQRPGIMAAGVCGGEYGAGVCGAAVIKGIKCLNPTTSN